MQFYTDYELNSLGIPERPERANYFADPSLLLFDWHYKIHIHYKNILNNPRNVALLPEEVASKKNLEVLLEGAILQMCRQVSANYKLAIPQYSNGSIQLLLPLCLVSPTKADLALKANKFNGYYQCNTCLSLEEAYNNARLIARPEHNWLSIEEYEAPTAKECEEVHGNLGNPQEMTVGKCIFKTSKQNDHEFLSVVTIGGEPEDDYKIETISF